MTVSQPGLLRKPEASETAGFKNGNKAKDVFWPPHVHTYLPNTGSWDHLYEKARCTHTSDDMLPLDVAVRGSGCFCRPGLYYLDTKTTGKRESFIFFFLLLFCLFAFQIGFFCVVVAVLELSL